MNKRELFFFSILSIATLNMVSVVILPLYSDFFIVIFGFSLIEIRSKTMHGRVHKFMCKGELQLVLKMELLYVKSHAAVFVVLHACCFVSSNLVMA